MKKFVSCLVLSSIFLSSFFVLAEKNNGWKSTTTFQEPGTGNHDHNLIRTLVYTEVSSEKEDSESKSGVEVKFADFQNIITVNKHIKYILKSQNFELTSNIFSTSSTPFFIQIRSIII